MSDIMMVEFRDTTEVAVSQFFATHDGILSFDLDWHRDRLYWANQAGQVQRTGLSRAEVELVPTPVAGSYSQLLFQGLSHLPPDWLFCSTWYTAASLSLAE